MSCPRGPCADASAPAEAPPVAWPARCAVASATSGRAMPRAAPSAVPGKVSGPDLSPVASGQAPVCAVTAPPSPASAPSVPTAGASPDSKGATLPARVSRAAWSEAAPDRPNVSRSSSGPSPGSRAAIGACCCDATVAVCPDPTGRGSAGAVGARPATVPSRPACSRRSASRAPPASAGSVVISAACVSAASIRPAERASRSVPAIAEAGLGSNALPG